MKLLYRYLLSAAPLALLLLALVGGSRRGQPRAGGVEPKAVLNGLNPDSIAAGAPDFALTVNGAFFTRASVVEWNGQPRPTAFVSDSVLRARISAGDAALTGSALVTVRSSAALREYPGVSNALPFRIVPSNPF
jgi:hypothetical protein